MMRSTTPSDPKKDQALVFSLILHTPLTPCFLWDSGCLMNGTNDCGLACSLSEEGRNAVWKSPDAMFTLHNCMVYPILATAAEHGWLEQEQHDLLAKFNISASNMLLTNVSATYSRSPMPWKVVNICIKTVCDLLYGIDANTQCNVHRWISNTSYAAGPETALWLPRMASL